MKKHPRKIKILALLCTVFALFAALPAQKANAALYDKEKIASPYAAVYNVENDTFVFEKEADALISPSATAKLMTAVLALEYFPDLTAKVTATKEALNNITLDKFKIGIKTDENVTVEDLLYTMLVGNCTDSAAVLSYAIGGSHGAFGKMMNEKAQELGLTNTTFNSATGLGGDIERYHTTPRDSLILAAYAMKNAKLAGIVNTVKYEPQSIAKPINEVVYTRNSFLSTWVSADYIWKKQPGKPSPSGVSMNFSEESGYSLISSTNYKSLTYICICSGAFESEVTEENKKSTIYAYGDVKKLLLWAADEYTTVKVLDKSQIFGEIPVKLSEEHRYVVVVPKVSLYAFLPHDTKVAEDIRQEYEITEKELTAPVNIGQKVGTVRLYYGEKEIASCDLVAKTQIEKSGTLAFLSAVFSKNMIISLGVALLAACLYGIIRFFTFLHMAKGSNDQNKLL
jgi:D-alanyl-D-alanine carboxypeptidase (penicillin-binding protein 5/6)